MARVGEPRLRHTRVGGSARQVVGGWVAREPMHSSKEWSSMIFLCVCVYGCSLLRLVCPLPTFVCACRCCFFIGLVLLCCGLIVDNVCNGIEFYEF